MFIQDGTTWKLAGIHYTVDGPFSLDGTFNTETNIAVMDMRGLYYLNETNWWTLIPTNQFGGAVPGSFYSSRVSVNASWINSVINYEPGVDLCINAVQIIGPDVQISLTHRHQPALSCRSHQRPCHRRLDDSHEQYSGHWRHCPRNRSRRGDQSVDAILSRDDPPVITSKKRLVTSREAF